MAVMICGLSGYRHLDNGSVVDIIIIRGGPNSGIDWQYRIAKRAINPMLCHLSNGADGCYVSRFWLLLGNHTLKTRKDHAAITQ